MDPDAVKKYCEENNVANDNALLTNKALMQTIFDNMMGLAAGAKFNSLEKPKQIVLKTDPWTIENDFLTPTMKMKRNVAKIRLADEIAALYASKDLLKPSPK